MSSPSPRTFGVRLGPATGRARHAGSTCPGHARAAHHREGAHGPAPEGIAVTRHAGSRAFRHPLGEATPLPALASPDSPARCAEPGTGTAPEGEGISMIAKVGPRSADAASLIRYVYRTGRTDDDPGTHIVAGCRTPAELEPPQRPDGRRDFRRLAGPAGQPVFALGDYGFARPVWHCVMRAAPDDRPLSDDEWAQIAFDVMDRTGLSPADREYNAVRWVAVRRGSDRIHIVATLARKDRRKPRLWNDWYRVRDACRASEERSRYSAPAADSHAVRNPSTREIRRARDHGLGEVPPPHAATPRQHRRRRSSQRGGVLRPLGAGRGARP